MQKLNTPEPRSTGLGAALIAALARMTTKAASTTLKAATVTKAHTTTSTPTAPRMGLFGPMFAATAAARMEKAAAKPVPALGAKPVPANTGAVRQHSVQSMVADRDFDFDNPLHVHAIQMRQSNDAHAALVAAVKATHKAGPTLNPSGGPVAI